jgi:hypothetical protein
LGGALLLAAPREFERVRLDAFMVVQEVLRLAG